MRIKGVGGAFNGCSIYTILALSEFADSNLWRRNEIQFETSIRENTDAFEPCNRQNWKQKSEVIKEISENQVENFVKALYFVLQWTDPNELMKEVKIYVKIWDEFGARTILQ